MKKILLILAILLLISSVSFARTTTTDLGIVLPTWDEEDPEYDILVDLIANWNIVEDFANDVLEFDLSPVLRANLDVSTFSIHGVNATEFGYLASVSSFGGTLIDDTTATIARATLGLTIGTNVQAYDAGLTDIAGLTTTAGNIIYTSASDNYVVVTPNSTATHMFLRQYSSGAPAWIQLDSDDLSDVASIAMLNEAEAITGNWVNTTNPWADNEVADDITCSSYQPVDGTLTALAGLTISTSSLIYGTGADAFSVLACNATATNKFLMQVSSGAPAWTELTSDHLSDTASIAMLDENESITGNWVNTTAPWADNEVVNDLTLTAADTNDETAFVMLWETITGEQKPKSDPSLTYNAVTGTLGATAFTGDGSLLTDVGAAEATAQTLLARATEQIRKGQAVYISGSTGAAFPNVSLCDADDSAKIRMIGVAVADIASAASGLIRMGGLLEGLNTSTATGTYLNPDDETWAAGQLLYVMLDGSGAYTKTRPTSGRVIKMGYSLYGDAVADAFVVMPHPNPVDMAAAVAEGIRLRLGAADASTKITIKDYADAEVASIDDDGKADFTSLTLDTVLAIAEGGTNSGTALNNDFVMVSSGSAIVESASITATELGLLNGVTGTLATTAVATLSSLTSVGSIATGGLASGASLGAVTMSLGSDADGDIYYRSSNVLTRLGKGTEGHYLKQGASIPEWAAVTASVASLFDITDIPVDPNADKFLQWDDDPGAFVWADSGAGGGADVNLSNIETVAIPVDLLSDTADTDSLGSATKEWLNLYIGDAGKIHIGLGQDVSLHRSAGNTLTVTASSGLSCTGKITAVGSFDIGDATVDETALEKLESTTSTFTQLNYISSATGTTGTTNTNIVFSTSPVLITPELGTPQSGILTNCTFPTLNQNTSGTAAVATDVTITANNDTAENNLVAFVEDADVDGGDLGLETDTSLTYNPSTGLLVVPSIDLTTELADSEVSNTLTASILTGALGGELDCNDQHITGAETVQFEGVHAIGNSGSTETVDWDNGAYQSITIDEACVISFSNEYVGTLNLYVTYGGSFALTFDGGVTLLEEGGVEIVTTDAAGSDLLIFKNLGVADTYVMGGLLDYKD